ncbi:MAG TPA: DUF2306 domain-containing protein [Bryobacteraceae bacterium]|nr:DUF2306 domain-containing protein [Bryobacteraceae bacterium]
MQPRPAIVRILWTATILLAAIGIASVIRRLLLLPETSSTGFDSGFARHPVLTTVHIIPGLLFMILGPLQFVRKLRVRHPRVHRWSGRVFMVVGLIIGGSALVIAPQIAIGGVNETVATLLFGMFFLVALIKAFLYIRKRNVAQHREWMIRAFAIGLAVATIRPIVGVFFATSRITHLTPQEFFGTAFWLGFTVQSMVAEIWINYTRPRPYRPLSTLGVDK